MMKYLKLFFIIGFIFSFELFFKVNAEEIILESKQTIKSPTLSINGNNNTLILTYDKIENATKYNIYRSNDGKKGWKKIVSTSLLTYTDKKLIYGSTYYYKVEAVGSSKITSKIESKKVIPNKVSNIKLKSNSTEVTITYNKTNNTGYVIERSLDNTNWTKVITIKKNSTLKHVDKKLKSNKKYYYRIRAYQTVNKKKVYGPYSYEEIKTAPAKVKLEVIDYNYEGVSLGLNSVSGANKYEVYMSNKKDGKYNLEYELTPDHFKDNKAIINYYLEKPYTNYYFKVRACNKDNLCGTYSLLTAQAKLSKSKILTAKPTTSSVTIIAEDTLMADSFEVYRSTKKSSGYKKIGNTKLVKYRLEYTDKNLKNNKTYYYKIRSYIKIGKKTYYSSYSSIKKVKTSSSALLNQAISDAKKVNNGMILSKTYLINELVNSFGYKKADAEKAVKEANINFKTNAVKYADLIYQANDKTISKESLKEDLKGMGFTDNEVEYALSNSKINYQDSLINAIYNELKYGISKENLIEDLVNYRKYSKEEVDKILLELDIDFKSQALIALEDNMEYYLSDEAERGMSKINAKNNLINQNKFTEEESDYAINNIQINWNHQASLAYKNISYLGYSKQKVIEALTDSYDNFTEEEVIAGLEELNVDFKKVALDNIKNYIKNKDLSRKDINDYLYNLKFTKEEIEFVLSNSQIDYNNMCAKFIEKNYLDKDISLEELKNELKNSYMFTDENIQYGINNSSINKE